MTDPNLSLVTLTYQLGFRLRYWWSIAYDFTTKFWRFFIRIPGKWETQWLGSLRGKRHERF